MDTMCTRAWVCMGVREARVECVEGNTEHTESVRKDLQRNAIVFICKLEPRFAASRREWTMHMNTSFSRPFVSHFLARTPACILYACMPVCLVHTTRTHTHVLAVLF